MATIHQRSTDARWYIREYVSGIGIRTWQIRLGCHHILESKGGLVNGGILNPSLMARLKSGGCLFAYNMDYDPNDSRAAQKRFRASFLTHQLTLALVTDDTIPWLGIVIPEIDPETYRILCDDTGLTKLHDLSLYVGDNEPVALTDIGPESGGMVLSAPVSLGTTTVRVFNRSRNEWLDADRFQGTAAGLVSRGTYFKADNEIGIQVPVGVPIAHAPSYHVIVENSFIQGAIKQAKRITGDPTQPIVTRKFCDNWSWSSNEATQVMEPLYAEVPIIIPYRFRVVSPETSEDLADGSVVFQPHQRIRLSILISDGDVAPNANRSIVVERRTAPNVFKGYERVDAIQTQRTTVDLGVLAAGAYRVYDEQSSIVPLYFRVDIPRS